MLVVSAILGGEGVMSLIQVEVQFQKDSNLTLCLVPAGLQAAGFGFLSGGLRFSSNV